MNAWLDEIKNYYIDKEGKFSHKTPKRAVLFPYTTNTPPVKTLEMLKNFQHICGEINRNLKVIKPEKSYDIDSLLDKITNKVESDNKKLLVDIIKKIAFSEDDNLYCFHPKIFYYILSKDSKTHLKSIGEFCTNVLFKNKTEVVPDYRKEGTENVFHDLILRYLPPLTNDSTPNKKKGYCFIDVGLSEVFFKDLEFISTPSLATKHLPELIKFYYLLYQLRSIEQLNYLFTDKKLEPIYFSLDWERLSKERPAYKEGWKRIEQQRGFKSNIVTMWSHANCIELLNYIPFKGLSSPFNYIDIKEWSQNADESDRNTAEESLNTLILFYKDNISKLGQDLTGKFDDSIDLLDDPIIAKAKLLFKIIHYQFINSERKNASLRYSQWFSRFVSNNFIKFRGRIGNTLAIDRQQMMFLTQLCIGKNKNKIRLRELWDELSLRGLAFDFDSKRQIVRLFEALNLLEKKSDSGDAQYVKQIF